MKRIWYEKDKIGYHGYSHVPCFPKTSQNGYYKLHMNVNWIKIPTQFWHIMYFEMKKELSYIQNAMSWIHSKFVFIAEEKPL